MEKVSVVWIEDQTGHNISLSQNLIQSKALTLFNSVKAEWGKEAIEEKSSASRGWFMGFKERNHLHNIQEQGEVASVNLEAAASYSENWAKVTGEYVYTEKQLFKVDEAAFSWKKMPSRISIASKSQCLASKFQKTAWALSLEPYSCSDFDLKLMLIYFSENPRALTNYTKSSLPVLYTRENKKPG